MGRTAFFRSVIAGTALLGVAAAMLSAQDKTKKSVPKAPPGKTPATASGKAPPKAATKAAPPAVQPARPEADAEKAVRKAADEFVTAYNSRDAKTIAAEFTTDAEFIDELGQVTRGRDAIERHFASVFAEAPEAKIKVMVETVRVIGPNIAVEEGTTEASASADAPGDTSRYVALHVLQEGKWLIAHVRDFPAESEPSSAHERLKPLQWMIGDWVDESPEVLIQSSCRWAGGNNFLLQEFKGRVGRQLATSGTMRIGWDPLTKQIRSWTFEGNGGFGEALWTGSGDAWTLKSRGVTADGRTTTATTIMKRIDEQTITWESRDRIVGDEALDDVGPYTVKRRAPAPGQ